MNDNLIYVVDVTEPDGDYGFDFKTLDELLKFCQVCYFAGFKITRIDTDYED